MITKCEVISSQLNFIEYDSITKVLTITFNNGKKYEYKDVPKNVIDSFIEAESKGSFFIKNIKSKYDYKPL